VTAIEESSSAADDHSDNSDNDRTESVRPFRRHRRGHDDPKPGSFWKELPILLIAAVVVALLVRTFLLETYWVPSPSMEHTLNVKDRVLVNKLVYDYRDPHRGEVIVFHSPVSWRSDPDETVFVKRTIGVGGDHLVCCDAKGRITVNGQPLDESYLDQDAPHLKSSPDDFNVVVPKGRLWVMGDNRYDSADSRQNYIASNQNIMAATIPVGSVIGRAFVLFWPFGRATWLTVPKTFSHVPDPPPAPATSPK
jgi:signal peptidase I